MAHELRARSASLFSRGDSEVSIPVDDSVKKDGWLYISRKRGATRFERRYCILHKDGDALFHMKSPKDNQKTKKVTLVLAQVSPTSIKGQKFTFQIVSRDETTILKAETIEEMNDWVKILQETCSDLLTDQIEDAASAPNNETTPEEENTAPEAPLELPQVKLSGAVEHTTVSVFLQKNDYCTDCSRILSEGYQGQITAAFVSLKIGCVLCEDCALCHLEILGKECSDVHSMQEHSSIPLFDAKLHPMTMAFLNYMGNKKANDYWEANLGGYNKPTSASPKQERQLWIKEKYLQKTFRGQKCGFLGMKDKKKTKKYWVVLETSTINLYNSKEDMKAQEIVVLQSCGVKVGDDPTCPETFTLITPGKTYRLEATNFPAAMEWANAISVASASLMKQLTNSSAKVGDGPARLTIPTEFSSSGPEYSNHKPIKKYDIASDHSEWGRTFTSVLQFEEQIQNMKDAAKTNYHPQIKEKIRSLEEQQFEVANLLLNLPNNDFASSLFKLMKDPASGEVTGGPVEALIEYLTTTNHQDGNFAYAWMLTYRAFTTPTIFLCQVSMHFNRKEYDVQKYICAFIESWICSHFYDWVEDGNGMRFLLAFLDRVVGKSNLSQESNRLKTMLRNQVTARLIPTRVLYDTAPEPIIPADDKLQFLSINDLDDQEIARQLTLIDQKLFQAIKPSELLGLAWLGPDKQEQAPNVSKFLDRYNQVVYWVLTTINKLDKPKRPFMLSKFIQIAKYCKDLRNYNCCMQIMAAVEDTIMLRFDGTWEGISQKYVPLLLDLRKLTAKSNNYDNLKQELYKRNTPCIPFLQAYLNEIQEIEKEEANFLDENLNPTSPKSINFKKFKKIGKLIGELRRYQSSSYILHPQSTVQCFLLNITALTRTELEALATLTHHREQILGLHDVKKSVELKLPDYDAPPIPVDDNESKEEAEESSKKE